MFVWRDLGSGTDVVVTIETGYGNYRTVFVLPNGVALCAAWSGDNSGPSDNAGTLKSLRKAYPNATVHASTFSAFFDEANKPENKKGLQVVTAEMGDAWIYGVPSDPLKAATFRELSRARGECISSGACNKSSPAMQTFDRLLVKIPGTLLLPLRHVAVAATHSLDSCFLRSHSLCVLPRVFLSLQNIRGVSAKEGS
jgi:hypothetical protein